jgi:hypothetical protein
MTDTCVYIELDNITEYCPGFFSEEFELKF